MANLISLVDHCFDQATDQQDALNRIYRLFVPDWDKVVAVKGYPACGLGLHRYLTHRFIIFDFEHHPEISLGHLWRAYGFTLDQHLADFEVSLRSCDFEMMPEELITECFT